MSKREQSRESEQSGEVSAREWLDRADALRKQASEGRLAAASLAGVSLAAIIIGTLDTLMDDEPDVPWISTSIATLAATASFARGHQNKLNLSLADKYEARIEPPKEPALEAAPDYNADPAHFSLEGVDHTALYVVVRQVLEEMRSGGEQLPQIERPANSQLPPHS